MARIQTEHVTTRLMVLAAVKTWRKSRQSGKSRWRDCARSARDRTRLPTEPAGGTDNRSRHPRHREPVYRTYDCKSRAEGRGKPICSIPPAGQQIHRPRQSEVCQVGSKRAGGFQGRRLRGPLNPSVTPPPSPLKRKGKGEWIKGKGQTAENGVIELHHRQRNPLCHLQKALRR